jgi:hypothetical protein
MRVGEHTGLHQGEVGVVAAVQRQLLDRRRADEVAQLRTRGVDLQVLAGDGDCLTDSADGQRDVHDDHLTDRQLQIPPHVGSETGQLGTNLVLAGRK